MKRGKNMNKLTNKLLVVSSLVLSSAFATSCTKVTTYHVSFKNYDSTVLYETTVNMGDTVVYSGEIPVRPDDGSYQYVFEGWDKPLENITEDTVFTAQYKKTNDFVVSFYSYDGVNLTLLQRNYVKNGDSVSYEGETPTKKADFEYYYTFKAWDKTFDNVTSNLDVFATYDQTSNVKDFDPSYNFWVYKHTEELDETNCSFKRAKDGLTVELVKPVTVDGKEYTQHHVNFTDMEIDLSNLDTSKIGEYDITITYKGIVKNEVIDVIPDVKRFKDEPEDHFTTGPDPVQQPAPDWWTTMSIDFYKYAEGDDETYSYFNDDDSVLYRDERFSKNDKDYITFYCIYNGVSTNVRYRIRYVGGGSSKTLDEYDFPEHSSSTGEVTIVSEALTTTLKIYHDFDESHSAYGQIKKLYYSDHGTDHYLKIAVKYDYDKDKKTIKVHHPDFPNVMTYDPESDTYK